MKPDSESISSRQPDPRHHSQQEPETSRANETGITRIFLSYARSDDPGDYDDPAQSFLHRLYNSLTGAGFEVWWDRVSMPGRGLTFLDEIKQAIDACDRLVLIVGPGAIESQYVREEWEYAYTLCKVINPVLRLGEFPLPAILPVEVINHDAIDFRDDAKYEQRIAGLIRQLSEKSAPLGPQFHLQDLPRHYVPRAEVFDRLKSVLLSHTLEVGANEGNRISLRGMAGVGKSVLAAAIGHDCAVRRAFPDGIYWVSLGQAPDIVTQQVLLGQALGDVPESYLGGMDSNKMQLSRLFKDQAGLIILDDVWDRDHLAAFDVVGPRSGLLFTTRRADLALSLGLPDLELPVMTTEQAVTLLLQWSKDKEQLLYEIADRLGNLPLALKLTGARLREGMSATQWLDTFQRVSLMKVGLPRSDDPQDNLQVSIELSVDQLAKEDRLLYHTLGIFPEDVWVPQAVVVRLWQAIRPDLDEFACMELTRHLQQLALLEHKTENDTVKLHDLLHDYNRQQLGEDLAARNQDLLACYNPDGLSWGEFQLEPYLAENLVYHLLDAGRDQDIYQLALSDDRQMREHIIATLSRFQHRYPKRVEALAQRWVTHTDNALVAQLAANIAVNCRIKKVLQRALAHSDETVRLTVAQNIFKLWQIDHELTVQVLDHLADQVNLFTLLRQMHKLLSLLQATFLLVTYDYNADMVKLQAETGRKARAVSPITEVQRIWKKVLGRLLLVSRFELVEKLMRRIRRLLVRIAVGRLVSVLDNLGGEGAFFSLQDFAGSFPLEGEKETALVYLLTHLDAAVEETPPPLSELVDYIKALIEEGVNDYITMGLSSMALAAHYQGDPAETSRAIVGLMTDLEKVYGVTEDRSKPTASLWYLMAFLPLGGINQVDKRLDEPAIRQMIADIIEKESIIETRFRGTWQVGGNSQPMQTALFRTGLAHTLYYGYPDLFQDAISNLVETLFARKDFERLVQLPGRLPDPIIPMTAPQAVYETLKVMQPYLADLPSKETDQLWSQIADGITLFTSNFGDHLPAFIRLLEKDAALPPIILSRLKSHKVQENYGYLMGVGALIFLVASLKDQQGFVRQQIIQWGIRQLLQASSFKGWILDVIVHLSNLVYGGQLIATR